MMLLLASTERHVVFLHPKDSDSALQGSYRWLEKFLTPFTFHQHISITMRQKNTPFNKDLPPSYQEPRIARGV